MNMKITQHIKKKKKTGNLGPSGLCRPVLDTTTFQRDIVWPGMQILTHYLELGTVAVKNAISILNKNLETTIYSYSN